MSLNFHMPVQLITGRDCVSKNASLLASMGTCAMIVTGGSSAKKSGALDDVTGVLTAQKIPYVIFDEITQNPLLSTCAKAGAIAREQGVDFLIGIGGGSPLDATKAIAVYAANEMAPDDIYLHNWKNPLLPFALVGTTAGTASEITKWGVMTGETGRKRSFGNETTYARYAFCDGKYTDSLPLSFTLSTTLDAVSHALEGYFSTAANAVSDVFAIEAMRVLVQVHRQLLEVTHASQITQEQRDALYDGAILAGFALNHCGTCYCHTLGYFLSEDYGIPHGFACAATLVDFVERMELRLPDKAAALYAGVNTTPQELREIINRLLQCELPALTPEQIEEITARYPQTIANFVRTAGGITTEEIRSLLQRIYGK